MRRVIISVVSLLLMLGTVEESLAQFNRKSIRRNNKRMANFKGRKSGFKNKAYTAVGFSIDALNYYGDLAPKPQRVSTDISFTRPAVSASIMHRFGPRYTLLSEFRYGTLRGSDNQSADLNDLDNGVFRYQRNLSFRNRIKELSVLAYFDLYENSATYISRVQWTPYAYVGVAGFLHNPRAKAPEKDLFGAPLPEAGKWVPLRPLGTEGQYATLDPTDVNYGIKPYSKIQAAIPFGMGARFRLTDVLDLWADIGFRYTFTDYLDDVSKNYVDLGVFKGNKLAQAMSYRSNELPASEIPSTLAYVGRDGLTYNTLPGYGREFKDNMRGSKFNKDIYMVTSIKITYILGATFHKAKFR